MSPFKKVIVILREKCIFHRKMYIFGKIEIYYIPICAVCQIIAKSRSTYTKINMVKTEKAVVRAIIIPESLASAPI